MINKDDLLSETTYRVQNSIELARNLKNAALLRNISDLNPVLDNETRWSGNRRMLDRFIKLKDYLDKIRSVNEGDFDLEFEDGFLENVQRFAVMLLEIDAVTQSLQTKGHASPSCHEYIHVLFNAIAEQKEVPSAPLCSCKLGTSYNEKIRKLRFTHCLQLLSKRFKLSIHLYVRSQELIAR